MPNGTSNWFPDYYEILGVPRFVATQSEIRAAYIEQIKFFHPDSGNVSAEISEEESKMLNEIYFTLKDPVRKKQYDDALIYYLSQAGSVATKKPKKKIKGLAHIAICAAIIIVCLVGATLTKNGGKPPALTQTQNNASVPSTSANPNPRPSAQPVTGSVLYGKNTNRVAPLTVKTTGSNGYYIKLVDSSTKNDVLCFYVRGGSTCDIDVPLGTYILRYATGQTWYGTSLLFGDGTTYYEADDLFHFGIEDGYYTGWTVELYFQTGGNLDTDVIKKQDF